jgi:hypothetical protein
LKTNGFIGSEEGAHISVAKETENYSGMDEEIGKEFTFEVKSYGQ